jgi:hypothetical protein
MAALNTSIFRLRNLAALLITLSGVGQVAMLWFRELNGAAVIDAVIGFTYIIIGIGLQGQSRFTLFVAIAVPTAAAAWVMESVASNGPGSLQLTRLVLDVTVVMCSTVVLANTRKQD